MYPVAPVTRIRMGRARLGGVRGYGAAGSGRRVGHLQGVPAKADGAIMSGIRVCHLIHDLGPGGAEHVLVDLGRLAGPAGLEMSVVSMLPTEGLRYPEVMRQSGVTVRSLDLRSWWDPRGPRRLQSVVAELRPQVLHSHLKHADVVAGRVAARTGIPQVSTLHVIEDGVGVVGRLKRVIATRSRRRTAAMTIGAAASNSPPGAGSYSEAPCLINGEAQRRRRGRTISAGPCRAAG